LDASAISTTRTASYSRALSAVLSVLPFDTTTTSNSPGFALPSKVVSSRLMTVASLCAGMITLVTLRVCGIVGGCPHARLRHHACSAGRRLIHIAQ
jgi:hypothetical protein